MRRCLVIGLCVLPMAAACGGSSAQTPTSATPVQTSGSTSTSGSPTTPGVTTPTWDVAALGVPRFATANYIDLGPIMRISRFRSAEGHSYVDDAESCRSMKHYFQPRSDVMWSGLGIYAPADGDVTLMRSEQPLGIQVHIRPSAQPAFTLIIFHVAPLGIEVGSRVTAGQRIGSHIGQQTWSDIAVGVNVPGGYRLVSWFEAMTDGVFDAYRDRGIGQRGDLVISRAQRDADPLGCAGETFTSRGQLENWVTLR